MAILSGWGRYPVVDSATLSAFSPANFPGVMSDLRGVVARGNGRGYGDIAIGSQTTLSMQQCDRMLEFDADTGRLTVEAGVLLSDIIATFLPRGYFPAVVPGTRFVSVGGAIAADVHGKNHHRDGGFGDYVDQLVLATGSGEILVASREENPDVFFATVGGFGLTGVVLQATIRLRRVESGWIRQRTVVAPDLAAAMRALDDSDEATYSVAWIDCVARGEALGRSLIFLGEHASKEELGPSQAELYPPIGAARLRIPCELPTHVLNRWSVMAFNEFYFRAGRRKAAAPFLVPIGPYFFPLDGIAEWNRIYGARGFVQHQCVLPPETAYDALAEMLRLIVQLGSASFLAVLKKLGEGAGLMSFPRRGYTLALDFAVKDNLFPFLDALDEIVVAAGGRLYLAKDARQSTATFRAGYPNLDRFRDVCSRLDPFGKIRSRLSERLGV